MGKKYSYILGLTNIITTESNFLCIQKFQNRVLRNIVNAQ